jgi:hypothetical protein
LLHPVFCRPVLELLDGLDSSGVKRFEPTS